MGAAVVRCQGGTSAGMEALQIKPGTLLREVVRGLQSGTVACGMTLPQKDQRC